jgi:hypothetical protein
MIRFEWPGQARVDGGAAADVVKRGHDHLQGQQAARDPTTRLSTLIRPKHSTDSR